MKRLALVLLLVLATSSVSASRSIVLIYDRSGREGLASGLGEALRPVFGESEVWVTQDPEYFNSVAFLPQVRLIFLLMNTREASMNGEAARWFFARGGSVLGNFDAGIEEDSGILASQVFPVYANTSTTAGFNRQTRRYEMVYVRKDLHEVTADLPDRFTTLERRMVIRWSEGARRAVRVLPPAGTVSDLYVEEGNGFPLVVLYEKEGRSAFFSSLDPPSDISKLLGDANYTRLLSSVVAWLMSGDRKSSVHNLSAFKIEISRLNQERASERQAAERMRRSQILLRVGLDVLIVGLSAAAAWLVYKFLIKAQREGPAST